MGGGGGVKSSLGHSLYPPHVSWYPMVLNIPQNTQDIPHSTQDAPHSTHDISHGTQSIPHDTEHSHSPEDTLYRVFICHLL